MASCTTCSATLPDHARYCPNCGAPVTADAARPAPPSASAARIHPGDHLRDGIAALALVFSLFMVWILDPTSPTVPVTGLAAARIDVLLITLLSIASLSIPHLGRAGVFGPRWNEGIAQDARMLANVPYGVLVVVYLVLALVGQLTLGPAMAFGFAGAVLAAQPRRGDLAGDDGRRDRRWIAMVAAVAGLSALVTLVQIAEMFTVFSADGPSTFVLAVVLGVANAGLLAVAACGVLLGHRTWQRISVGIGITGAVFALLALSPQVQLVDTTLHGPTPGVTLMFWIAFGAAASAPSVRRRMRGAADAGIEWAATARTVLPPAIAVGALVVVVSVIELIRRAAPFFAEAGSGSAEWTISLLIGIIVIAGGAACLLLGNVANRAGDQLMTLYACLLLVLGLVLLVTWSLPQSLPFDGVGVVAPVLAFALPAGIAGCLWLPAASRARYLALPPAGRPGRGAAPVPAENAGAPAVDGTESAADGAAPTTPTPTPDDGTVDAEPAATAAAAAAVPADRDADVASAEQDAAGQDATERDAVERNATEQHATERDATEQDATGQDATGQHATGQHATEQHAAERDEETAEPTGDGSGEDTGPEHPAAATAAAISPADSAALVAEAADPATPLVRLHELAALAPETHVALAGNPATYPSLLEWLGRLHDPAVDAALAARDDTDEDD